MTLYGNGINSMALTRQEIQALSEMVVAGGKSPNTGGDGLMIAAGLIQNVLQRELKALEEAERLATDKETSE